MKNVFFFIVYTFTAVLVFPQSMVVQKNDGTNLFIDLNTIDMINFIIPCPGTPTVDYEDKIYNTVLIGDQCWLKENIDVGTMINSSSYQDNNGILEKYCYDNDPANCITYGGLYQWNEAMQYVTTERAQGICPSGWHIPSYAEFQTLAITVENDGNTLKEIGQGSGGGAGTNTSGFSGLLAGFWERNNSFGYFGYYADFWISTEIINTDNAYYMYLYYDYTYNLFDPNGYYKDTGFSVRCLRD